MLSVLDFTAPKVLSTECNTDYLTVTGCQIQE